MSEGQRGVRAPGVTEAIIVLFGLLVLFSLFFGWRTSSNTHRIELAQWEFCTQLNAAHARQNKILDTAIETEKARSNPNPEAIKAYEEFKFLIRDCGEKP